MTNRYLGTYRKNIQEGISEETNEVKGIFNAICLKNNKLENYGKNCTF